MLFSKSSHFKNVQSNCEQRKHDFQTITTHRSEVFDDTEAPQSAAIQNENLKRCWVLDGAVLTMAGVLGPCEHLPKVEPGT